MGKGCKSVKTDQFAAEMFWECLRRRNDYRDYYKSCVRAQKVIKESRGQGDLARAKKYSLAKKYAHCAAYNVWGITFQIDPNKPFPRLAKHEKSYLLRVDTGFCNIEIASKELDRELSYHLFNAVHSKGYLVPKDYKLIIKPIRPLATKNRAGINQFRVEMLAWDLKKMGCSWRKVGMELEKAGLNIPPIKERHKHGDYHPKVTAYKCKANDYYKAAKKKIEQLKDWRPFSVKRRV